MSDELPDSDWLPHAERLKVGTRARISHDCGEGSPLLITRMHDKSTAYCFRCGGRGFKREHESLEAKLIRTTAERGAERKVRATVELPQPQVYDTTEWPLVDKVWFFKMGLSLRMIGELKMYWCPAIGRVVLPIMEDDRPIYWTARSSSQAPKWLTPDVPKDGLVARYGVGTGDSIVLCEDPLSAYKVGLVTEAWSLLGTKLHNRVLMQLIERGQRVVTWLDDDRGRHDGSNPGQTAARKIAARLRAFGVDCRNITSDRDPKYYPTDYIKEALQ
jgi:hypothetical protein